MDCQICLEPFDLKSRLPMSISCFHSFCAVCLKEWSENGPCLCPTCRNPFQPSHACLNYGMRDMLDHQARAMSSAATQTNCWSEKRLSFNCGEMGINHDRMRVSLVKPEGQAAALGVQVGWSIVSVNDSYALSSDHLTELVKSACLGAYSVTFNTRAPERLVSFAPGKMGIIYTSIRVAELESENQAAMVGVQIGWGITAVNGVYATSQDHLTELLESARAKKYSVIFNMDAPECVVSFAPGRMGITFSSMRVNEVHPDGQAVSLGVQTGWGITAVNGEHAKSQDHLRNLLENARANKYSVIFNMEAPSRVVSFAPGKMGISHSSMRVTELKIDGQAAAVGVQTGWGITAVDGIRAQSHFHLTKLLELARASKYSVIFNMDAPERVVAFAPGRMGIAYSSMCVTALKPDGQALALGVQTGWGIAAVNGTQTRSHDHIKELLESARASDYSVTFVAIVDYEQPVAKRRRIS